MLNKLNNSELTILIVDDEIEFRENTGIFLERKGFNVLLAENGIEALKIFDNTKIDIAIIDYYMPQMQGGELIDKVTENNKETVFILSTAHSGKKPKIEMLENYNIQAYFDKQKDKNDFFETIISAKKVCIQILENKRIKDGLNNILKVIPQIYQLSPIEDILEKIILSIMKLIKSDHAFVIVDSGVNTNEEDKNIFKAIGKFDLEIKDFFHKILSEKVNENNDTISQLIGSAREIKETLIIDNYIFLPLIDESKKDIGIICIISENIDDNIQLLEIFSKQVATSISNAFLHLEINKKEEQLSDSYAKLEQNYSDTIQILRLAIDQKSPYTRGHSDRTSFYSIKIGIALQFNDKDIEILKLAGLFHDIGKIGVKDDILHKEGTLTREEYKEMQTHSIRGSRMLKAVSGFESVSYIVRFHHQWYGGGENSYPDNIKGEEIPLFSRILTVADSFDAMDSKRSYRDNLALAEIKKQLKQGIGTQFDPQIINIFLDLLDKNYEEWREELEYSFNIPSYIDEIE